MIDETVSIEIESDHPTQRKSHEQTQSLDSLDLQPVQTIELDDSTQDVDPRSYLIQRQKNARYAMETELGRGGMGVIMGAKDTLLGRQVAMKIARSKCSNKQYVRFITEAQITGQLEHPNIIPVHELGVDKDEQPYFTMKLVEGRSLADALIDKENRPSILRLVHILIGVTHAISYAHDKGVLHRDLKPANIMLGQYGEVLLMDWGLAKAITNARDETNGADEDPSIDTVREENDRYATLDGSILGTPAYMSPEQASGRNSELDQRSDIFSLGAILFEFIFGDAPIQGEGIHDTLHNARVGLIEYPDFGWDEKPFNADLISIAKKAMARDPEDRYQNVNDFRTDL